VIRKYDYGDLTEKVIAACFEVHRSLGPGFPERIYLNALKIMLEKQEMKYETEKEFLVKFQDTLVSKFRIDLLIEDKVIVEIKSIEGKLPKVFESQVISYLKASGLKVGLLVNFGSTSCQICRLMV
jgi:GxxExxY protein